MFTFRVLLFVSKTAGTIHSFLVQVSWKTHLYMSATGQNFRATSSQQCEFGVTITQVSNTAVLQPHSSRAKKYFHGGTTL